MQFWDGSYNSLGIFMFILGLLCIIFLVVMIYGAIRKKIGLILTLPVYILSIFLWYLLINLQQGTNFKNANILVKTLKHYRVKNGHFPENLMNLSPEYISHVPKEWYGLRSSNFSYRIYGDGKNYSLETKLAKKTYNIYESALRTWQFLD